MRRYGLYDATRGLMTALAVGLAGLLLWVATQVGVQSTARFWAAMGIVAGGGLVLALLPALGGWTSGLRLRISPGALLLGVLPALVVTRLDPPRDAAGQRLARGAVRLLEPRPRADGHRPRARPLARRARLRLRRRARDVARRAAGGRAGRRGRRAERRARRWPPTSR